MPSAPGLSPACSGGGLCAAATKNAGTSARTVKTAPARARAAPSGIRGPHQCAASIWKKRRSKELNSSTGHVRMKRAARSSNTSTMSASCSAPALFLPITRITLRRESLKRDPTVSECQSGSKDLYRRFKSTPLRPVHVADRSRTPVPLQLLPFRVTSGDSSAHERCRFSRGPTTRSLSMPSGQRRARMRSVPSRPSAEAHAALTFLSTPSDIPFDAL